MGVDISVYCNCFLGVSCISKRALTFMKVISENRRLPCNSIYIYYQGGQCKYMRPTEK